MNPTAISFGGSECERLQIEVLGYEREPVGEFYDDNWLSVRISVVVGGFRGQADAAFLTSDFESFLLQLRPLYESLGGTAEFRTIEGQLRLGLIGDGKGHVAMNAEFADRTGTGNRLIFSLGLDQTQLGEAVRQIEQVISVFPVRRG